MTGFDYRAWRASVERAVTGLLAGFESQFGYPPDEHSVGGPSGEELLEVAQIASTMPDELLDFYRHVSVVDFPDLHNGFYIHRLEQVLATTRMGRRFVHRA
jgi:hypothetical protein